MTTVRVSGLVAMLRDDPAPRPGLVARLEADPRVTVGPLAEGRLALAFEARDAREERHFFRQLEADPAVLLLTLACHHVEDVPDDADPPSTHVSEPEP